MTLNVSPEENEMVEASFTRAGEKFTEATGERGFKLGLKGFEVGDGEQPPVFVRVELGLEILTILRGVLIDELHTHNTDPRFTPHITLFGGCSLDPVKRKELFKTADQLPTQPISVRSMSLCQRQSQQSGSEQVTQRVIQYQF